MNIDMKRIAGTNDPLFNDFKALYADSFPVFEQRTEKHQASAFLHSNYHVEAYVEQEQFIGFIAYWAFQDYLYIEHYAIHKQLRGQGYGSRILQSFIASHPEKVLLEIDPIQDEISAARLRFYQHCGFVVNTHRHVHPPYREGYHGHDLLVLTTQRTITAEEYKQFATDLSLTVMEGDR